MRLRPASEAAASRPRRRNVLPWILAAGWLGQVLIRLWCARTRTGPGANPDETGYLIAARWLAGGPGGDLSGNTFYQGGYPLLLTPAYWLADDPVTVYTLVMAINALVSAAAFPLGYLVLRRMAVTRRPALALAWAAALFPATTFFGAYALTDAVLPVIVLGWIVLLERFVRTGGVYWAAGSSLVASYAYAVHTRGLVLLCVHTAALLFLAVQKDHTAPKAAAARTGRVVARRLAARAGVGAAVGGYVAVSAFHGLVQASLYPEGVRDLSGNIEARLTTLDGQLWAWSGAAGQIWYLIVSTWGLAGVGLVALLAALCGRLRESHGMGRVIPAVVLASTFGVAYTSSAALSDEHRVGNFAYGRYLSCLALVHALIGIGALVRSTGRQRAGLAACAAAIMAGSGAWVALYAGDRLRTSHFIGFDFPETSFLTADRNAFHLTTASVSAMGLLAAFLVLRRLHVLAVAAGLLAVSLAAMTFIVGTSTKRVAPASPIPLAAGRVAIDRSLSWGVRIILMYPVWWTRLERVDTRTGPPGPGVCTVVVNRPAGTDVGASWPRRPAGWTATTGDSWGHGWVAWRAPSCPRRR
ncbi:hypothetical protein GCM10010411_07290 [Actinomadura fulvescens]|uniref:Glycosyltransferase RgtA/B/C/D-like domain-containing protein n=2 Tax=Actinomadura fulvescens TaxID=46160 RepID=A0ABN3PFX3_9ACTN